MHTESAVSNWYPSGHPQR